MPSCVAVAWMFEDAGRAVMGSLTHAHLNPLRWSLPLSLKQVVAQLRRERSLLLKVPQNGDEQHERPIRISLAREGSSHQIVFETTLDAIDYLQQLLLDEEGPSVEGVQTASMKAIAAQPATDSEPLAQPVMEEAPAGDAADVASETAVEEVAAAPAAEAAPAAPEEASDKAVSEASDKAVSEVGVSQSIIDSPQKAEVSQSIIETTFDEQKPSVDIEAVPAKVTQEQKEEQPAAEAVAAVMEVAIRQVAFAEEPAAETEVAERAPMQKSRTEGSNGRRFEEAAEREANRSVQESGLAAAMVSTASDGAPMQRSKTEGSSKDRRYDFGFSLKLKRCSVCKKLGLNRGDEASKKIYCVACFDDIKC